MAQEKAQFFKAQIRLGQMLTAMTGIGGFNQGFQYVECCALYAVTQQEFLTAGKPLQRGHQPQDELVMCF